MIQGDVGEAEEAVTVGALADGDSFAMIASETNSKEPRH